MPLDELPAIAAAIAISDQYATVPRFSTKTTPGRVAANRCSRSRTTALDVSTFGAVITIGLSTHSCAAVSSSTCPAVRSYSSVAG